MFRYSPPAGLVRSTLLASAAVFGSPFDAEAQSERTNLPPVTVTAPEKKRAGSSRPPRNVAQFLSGPYRIPNIHVEASMMLTNKTPIGTYRGPGRFEADFFRERLFDMAAKDLGIDRVEFRRRNLVKADELPYPLATITPVDSVE